MRRAHLPEGPASLAELVDWPAWVAKVLCSPHEHMPASRPDWQTRRDTVQTLLRFGLVLDTDFSGKGCAEVAMQCLLAGYEKIGMRVPEHALTLWRACDIDLVCQEIWCEADSPVGAKHVFKDLLSRIPEQHQRAIQGLRPWCQGRGPSSCVRSAGRLPPGAPPRLLQQGCPWHGVLEACWAAVPRDVRAGRA